MGSYRHVRTWATPNSTRVRGPIAALLLHFVEVAPVGVERVVGFFVGPVVGHLIDGSEAY
jgi:hypothetical protein